MGFQILTINPGSTSTKVAWFDDDKLVWKDSVEHDAVTLSQFPSIAAQFELRASEVEKAVESTAVI